jgi:hypothetical protein
VPALVLVGVVVLTLAPMRAGAADGDPPQVGQFTAPFEEAGAQCHIDADGRELCKPAGATQAALPTGRVLFWDALEGTENINLNAVAEGAHQTRNDRTRSSTSQRRGPLLLRPVFLADGRLLTVGGTDYFA